jgi:hypothetical protein
LSEGAGDVSVQSETKSWRTAGFQIDPERILRVQGYRDPTRIRPRVRTIAERIGGEIAGVAAPEARYVRCRIETVADGVLSLEGGYRFSCAAFDRLLANATDVIVFVLTLGPALDETVAARHAASEPVDALFLESAGWLCVEKATRMLAADIQADLASEGLGVTFRLGPGYDYKDGEGRAAWGLEEQPELFRVFGDAPLPIELLDSCAMLPKLSRSGLFGLAPRS